MKEYMVEPQWFKLIYKIPYEVTRSTELQAFQYKILHRIISCNHWLHRIGIKESDNCGYCKAPDTLEHFFYSCPQNNAFWKSFLNWWNKLSPINVKDLNPADVLLGIPTHLEQSIPLNACILVAKKYIYEHRINNRKYDLYKFLVRLKTYLEFENYICLDDNSSKKFHCTWDFVFTNI